ncbi:precorrin-3B synthase [Catenuloplanes atrovinosus]|uniref:Precorrin-3B synthase n=1 Tax=Catenuloplanes atrovinosus TaxID=137266 RepID=A0AAE4C7F4_9ACTN|nr:precorrin-3B synthase [Catenuloplanes atrovinosus]MDR7274481.1 precorrin-3B synthase [Catenuloplanes atrovinosus]
MSPTPVPGRPAAPVVARTAPSGGVVVRTGPDACPTALQVHAAADGGLARVRIPGGVVTADQARVLARAARELGDGHLDQTSRGNLQLRALPPGAETELGARLAEAGLLPSATHERARNIVASPLSGLDGAGLADVRPLIGELDAALCAAPALAALSGRFLFALDDGRGDVAALHADICLAAVAGGGFALLLDGVDHGVRTPAGDAPGLAVAAAEAFLAERAAQGSAGWRMSEIDQGATRVAARLGATAAPVRERRDPPAPPAGVIGSGAALAVIVPLGRISAGQLDLLADLAAEGAGELRFTPWRGVVVPGPADAARPAAAGLVTGTDSPWYGVTACAGRPGCAKSRADVRADATAVVALDPPRVAPRALPVHWAGCERACGHPATPHVLVLATPGGYRVDGSDDQTAADLDRLAAVVAGARTNPTYPAQETGA